MQQNLCSTHTSEERCSLRWLTPRIRVTDAPGKSWYLRIKCRGREPLGQRALALFTDVEGAHLHLTVTMYTLIGFPHLMIFQEKTHSYTPFFKKSKFLIFNGNSFKTFEIILQAQQHMSVGWVWLAVCWFSTSSWIYGCSKESRNRVQWLERRESSK